MTKQDDVNLNTSNPLTLRAAANGGGPMIFADMDANFLNLMRAGNAWTNTRLPYTKSEVVYHNGFIWLCTTDNSDEPTAASANWTAFTGISGLGGMYLAAPTLIGQDITAIWQPLTMFDTVAATERGILSDATADTFVFSYPGIWDLSLNVNISHPSLPSARTFGIRTFNVTDAIAGGGLVVGIGRNSEATIVSTTLRFRASEADMGKTFRIEIGGSDAVTVDEWWSCDVAFTQIGV